jgi:hypothetical protein
MVVDFVAMRICLVRAFSLLGSGSDTVRAFFRVVAVVFDDVEPFGRPRGFGAVSVLAAVDVSGTAFFLGLPTRFLAVSVFEASSSPSSLSVGDSAKAGTGVAFLARVVVVVVVLDAAVEAFVAE